MIKYAKDKEDYQGQTKVNQRLHIFGKQKQIFWHINLGEYPGIAGQRGHSLRGSLIKIAEHQITTKQVSSIMRHITPKELGKHQTHNQQCK